MNEIITLTGSAPSTPRPAPRRHAPLPPWDKNNPDGSGNVATTPPPDLHIPPLGTDNMFLRADFNGVCLDLARFKLQIDFSHNWLIGANSTPFNMLMTPMAPMYVRSVQDAMLTEHAERGYTHFVVESAPWNQAENGFHWTPAQFVAWCQYVKSWGFKVVYWHGVGTASDPFLTAALKAKAVDWIIIGQEVDRKMSPEQYDVMLDQNRVVAGDIPCAAHFTSNYPIHLPRELYVLNWAKYDGWLHLFWQADQHQTAGTQAALLWYARSRVNLGGMGGVGGGAPNSRVYAFETMAAAQLYPGNWNAAAQRPDAKNQWGGCTEEYGNLRDLELLYAPSTEPRMRAISGFGNGCRLRSGEPI